MLAVQIMSYTIQLKRKWHAYDVKKLIELQNWLTYYLQYDVLATYDSTYDEFLSTVTIN